MAKTKNTEGPLTVSISVMNDGTVSLVFPRAIEQFNASAEEMQQLGVNLIKAATVATMQHAPMVNGPAAPTRRM